MLISNIPFEVCVVIQNNPYDLHINTMPILGWGGHLESSKDSLLNYTYIYIYIYVYNHITYVVILDGEHSLLYY